MARLRASILGLKGSFHAIPGGVVDTTPFHKVLIMRHQTKYFLLVILLFILPLGFSGYQDKDFELSKNLDIYHTLMRELNLYYVDEINPGKTIKSSIDNMLARLDPYTVYIPESQMEDLRLMTTGEYGGVGATIRQREGKVIIADPYENFPVHKAGLRAGDIIQKIDGRDISDLKSSEISEMMKGQIGTTIKMQVRRPFAEGLINAELLREKIRISNVPHYQIIDNNTGYIRLGGFTQGAAKELESAYKDLKEQGIDNLIIDLRSNPGGLLIEAVDIMNIFVNQNEEIVSTKGKVKQWSNTYYCRRQALDTLIPIAVLINSQSASAAEIIAGAMQDLDRGVVIGQRSFGKGLVQTTRDLSYNSKLKITTAKYYIPSGRCIQAVDYSNRREDGSVGKIPDSLITEFKTRNGRVVLDGGGIIPDRSMEPRVLSKITTALIYQHKFFDFATQIRNTREELSSPASFVLSETDLEDFVTQLKRDSFQYETGSERMLKELEKIIELERYDKLVGNQIEELKSSLANNIDKDIDSFEDEIIELLSEEIISRYYYQKGRIEFFLSEDPTIKEAIEILSNQQTYKEILKIKP